MPRKPRNYTEDEVRAALAAYVRTGSLRGAQKETGTPWETIRSWKEQPKWKHLLTSLQHQHSEEIRLLWLASARDAAEGMQEAVLRCRQGLRQPELKPRDAAIILRTLVEVLSEAHEFIEEPPDDGKRVINVTVYRGMGKPPDPEEEP